MRSHRVLRAIAKRPHPALLLTGAQKERYLVTHRYRAIFTKVQMPESLWVWPDFHRLAQRDIRPAETGAATILIWKWRILWMLKCSAFRTPHSTGIRQFCVEFRCWMIFSGPAWSALLWPGGNALSAPRHIWNNLYVSLGNRRGDSDAHLTLVWTKFR